MGYLDASPADIDQHAVVGLDAVHGPQEGEAGLVLAVDHRDFDAGFLTRALQELGPVLGISHR